MVKFCVKLVQRWLPEPFVFAIPALSIANLIAKDIMGYCLIDLFITGLIICSGLLLWAM